MKRPIATRNRGPGYHVAYALAALFAWSACNQPGSAQQVSNTEIGSAGDAVSIENVISGLERNEKRVENLSVTSQFENRGLDMETRHVRQTCIVDAKGRVWWRAQWLNSGMGSEVEPAGGPEHADFVFDGETATTVEWRGDRAIRANIMTYARWYGGDPFKFSLIRSHQTPFSQLLRKHKGSITGTTSWDGRQVLVVETAPVESDDRHYKQEYLIDPDRDFTIVRYSLLRRLAGTDEWEVNNRNESHDHSRVDGVWLPSHTIQQIGGFMENSVPVTRSEGRHRDWKVNADIPEDRFRLEIPVGTLTRDGRTTPPRMFHAPDDETASRSRVESAFNEAMPILERYERALRDAQLADMRVLLVLADPQAACTRQLYTFLGEADDLECMDDYRVVYVSNAGENSRAQVLAQHLSVTLEGHSAPVLVILDSEGRVLAQTSVAGPSTGELNREKAAAMLKEHAVQARDAQQMIADAKAQAKREGKCVLVQFTATWCGPCWQLSRFLDRHRPLLGQHLVHVKIDTRWKHSDEVTATFWGDEPRGLPWMAILDAEGKTLATSDGPDGNIGFPNSEAGIQHFAQMLRLTASRMSDAELEGVIADLKGR